MVQKTMAPPHKPGKVAEERLPKSAISFLSSWGLAVDSLFPMKAPLYITLAAICMAGLFFFLDISMPLGIAGGIPYVALVMMGIWFPGLGPIYVLAALGTVLTVAGYFVSPDGSDFWIVVVNRTLALFAIWITAVLIASRKGYERTLEQERERLTEALFATEQANLTKSRFLASMSHEIRTPMTGIMGFADLLLDDALEEKSQEKVLRIKDATNGLLRIINDILDLSKIDAGKMDVQNIDFHVAPVIDEVLGLVNTTRQSDCKLKIAAKYDDNFPQVIHSDSTRIRQILINLTGNAVKFTHDGSITVEGDLFQSGDGQDYVRFAVQDTGIGILPEVQASLFDNFTQVDTSITRKYEGTGLGLAISKRLVELMGGEIGVESDVGTGSRFWFTVPYVPGVMPVEEKAELSPPKKFKATRPLNVLVVDDNRVNQRIIMALVQSFGHRTALAEDGAQAVESHKQGDFDLILMDIRMPVMSGIDASRVIRQMDGDKARIPIIAQTGDVMDDHKKEYFEAGMDAVVGKPIDRRELALTINDVMGEELHVADRREAT